MRILLFEVNSVLKLLLSAFNQAQNVLWRYEGDMKQISSRITDHNNFLVVFFKQRLKVEKVGPSIHVHSCHSLQQS